MYTVLFVVKGIVQAMIVVCLFGAAWSFVKLLRDPWFRRLVKLGIIEPVPIVEVLPEPRVLVEMVWLDGWLGLDEEMRVPVKDIITKYTPKQREQLSTLLSAAETARFLPKYWHTRFEISN